MAQSIKGGPQARLALQVLVGVSVIWWVLFWLFQPVTTAKAWLSKIDTKVNSTFLGARGSIFLLQAVPIMVISFLSYFVLELKRRIKRPIKFRVHKHGSNQQILLGFGSQALNDWLLESVWVQTTSQKPNVNIWTLPIIVKSPLGMLTLGDLIFIMLTLFIVCWYFTKSLVNKSKLIDQTKMKPGDVARWLKKMISAGDYLGKVSLIPFALLWIPVSRGSPILRILGIPFERAVKYHVWLGLLTVWLVIAHGVVIAAFYIRINEALEIVRWESTGIAVLPGVVALVAGVLMLLTALNRVRRDHFDLFFSMHHLYLVFLLFFAFHCVSQMIYVVIPVLVFFLDRFMRVVQSRKAVSVVSAKVLPSGVMELKFAKPASLTYHPLSFVYIRLPSISRLQWHPFSVASTPLDNTNQITIYIKALGGFTKDLQDALTKQIKEPGNTTCPFSFKMGLEGFYGSESMFYIRYTSLVMVAGGIGVTPFLAILRDILFRYKLQLQQDPDVREGLPSSIDLIFCIRNQDELCILDSISPDSILPNYEEYLSIKIHAFVTSQSPTMELSSVITNSGVIFEEVDDMKMREGFVEIFGPEGVSVQKMSMISGSGNNIWVAATVAATLLGYLILRGIFNVTVKTSERTNYVQVFIYVLTMSLSVLLFGGGVMLVWALKTRKESARSDSKVTTALSPIRVIKNDGGHKDIETSGHSSGIGMADTAWQGNIICGRRPNWKELFTELASRSEHQEFGVMVSGGVSMQEDVAKECKHLSLSRDSKVVFHYHSVSFEL